MSRAVKRSVSQAVRAAPASRSRPNSALPLFVPPQLTQPVEKPPSGPQWLHEIKLDGYRMAARIDNGRVQLLIRTGLDWTSKYPSAIAARKAPALRAAVMCHIRELANHSKIGLQVEVIWTLPRTVSLMVSE
jgi:ATP-dependent DNA ligase